jgi:hypothetical protein
MSAVVVVGAGIVGSSVAYHGITEEALLSST